MAQVSTQKKSEMLRNSVLAAELTGDECDILAELIVVHDLVNGDTLVAEGESDSRVHVIVKGTLAVAKYNNTAKEWLNLYTMTQGDLAGELSFMDNQPHYAALRAVGSTRVFSLEREKLESLLDKEPLIVYRVMRAIFRFVHNILHRMGAQQAELIGYLYREGNHYY